MKTQAQITIRDIPANKKLIMQIEEKTEKLEQFCDRMQKCHIVISQIQKNQQHGKFYKVHIDIKVPKDEIVVNKTCEENVYLAIRAAFNAAARQLKTHMLRRRGE